MQENVFTAGTSSLVREQRSPLNHRDARGPPRLSLSLSSHLPVLVLLFFTLYLLHIFPSPPFTTSTKQHKL